MWSWPAVAGRWRQAQSVCGISIRMRTARLLFYSSPEAAFRGERAGATCELQAACRTIWRVSYIVALVQHCLSPAGADG